MSQKNVLAVYIPLDNNQQINLKLLSVYTKAPIRRIVAKWVNDGIKRDVAKIPEIAK